MEDRKSKTMLHKKKHKNTRMVMAILIFKETYGSTENQGGNKV